MMYSIEAVGDAHAETDYKYEEDYKFLEGHKSSERHDSYTVGCEHVDRTHKEGVGCYSHQRSHFKYFAASGGLTDGDDDESLDEEHLPQNRVTVE